MTFRISNGLLQASIYLYPDADAAETGKKAGGCGFILGWPVPSRAGCTLWAVTNRHVIDDGAWTVRVNTKDGGTEYLDTDDSQWIFHETADLAVRPFPLSQDRHAFNFITDEWLLSREWFETLDMGPGDPCFTIGRFVGSDGKQRNTPTVRFGQIAQLNSEPIRARGTAQDSFLVECRSIGGYSGAPVFVWLDRHFYRTEINGRDAPDGTKVFQGVFPDGPWLLGVNWCMIADWQRVCDANYNELQSGYQVPANTGIMGVIPAWHLRDMFETGAASETRTMIEQMIAERDRTDQPAAMPTSGAASSEHR